MGEWLIMCLNSNIVIIEHICWNVVLNCRGDDSIFVSVAAGDESSLAIDASGSVWMWGGGDERLNGRSGGFVSSSVLPYRIPQRLQGIDDYDISSISVGKHYLALLDKKETLLVLIYIYIIYSNSRLIIGLCA